MLGNRNRYAIWGTEDEILFLKNLLWNTANKSSLEIICIFPLWSLFANQTSVTMRRLCILNSSRGSSRIESVEHNFRCLSLLARSYCSITHQTECLVTSSNSKSVVKKITVKSNVQWEPIYHWDIPSMIHS